jgi:hypothetical protein
MRHRTALTAAVLGAALAAGALSGCSSDSSGKTTDDAKSTASAPATTGGGSAAGGGSSAPADPSATPGKPAGRSSGHVDYTGDANGSADFTGGVACEVKNGKLIGVTTPDVLAKKPIYPSLIATTADSPTQVALFNTPDGKPYAGRVAKSGGVTAQKNGATWTVTLDGLKIAKDYGGSGPVITLKRSLTCTRMT